MILYDKEKEETSEMSFEELLNQELDGKESRSDNSTSLSSEELEKAMYNAMKKALEDYEDEKNKKEAENEEILRQLSEGQPSPTPSPTPEPQVVYVNNFPTTQDVNVIDWHTMTDALPDTGFNNDAVAFGTSTDSRLYTLSTSAPVSSATGQSAVYLLEIRNIVLIFCLLWFVVYVVSMLKRTSKKFGKGE